MWYSHICHPSVSLIDYQTCPINGSYQSFMLSCLYLILGIHDPFSIRSNDRQRCVPCAGFLPTCQILPIFSSFTGSLLFSSSIAPYQSQLLPIQLHLPLEHTIDLLLPVMPVLQWSLFKGNWLDGNYLACHSTTTPRVSWHYPVFCTLLSQPNVTAFTPVLAISKVYAATCLAAFL